MFQKFLYVFLVAGLLFNLQAGKKALDFKTFFELPRLSNPVVSPDGEAIAFTITVYNVGQNNSKTKIRVIDASGRKIYDINDEKSVTAPVFDQKGNLYFKKNGKIFNYGTGKVVYEFAPGISGLNFSRNNQMILFKSKIYPDCENFDCVQKRDEAKKNSKVKARIYDHLFYRHWDAWYDGKRNHLILAGFKGNHFKDFTPGDFDTPPQALGSAHDYCFSPDSREIAYVSNHDPVVAISTNNDVFIKPVSEGPAVQISTGKGNDMNPEYSPNGKYLAYKSMKLAGFEADRQRIMIYNRKAKTQHELTKGFKLSVAEMVWSPDSRLIYFTAPEQGYNSIYSVNIQTAKIKPVLKGHYLSGITFLNSNELIFAIQTSRSPKEIFKYNLNTKKLTQLTHITTKKLSQFDLPGFESFWFAGANGDSVEGFIMKPPSFENGRKYPAIELIHGGPQGMWSDDFHYRWNYQMFASKGYVLFWINFHGSTGYGQDFTDAISHHWGDLPFEDIMKGTDYVLNHYDFIDKDRLGAAGASYGGFMINWIEGHDNLFKCLVSHDGVYDQFSMWGGTEELWFPEWELNGLPWQEGSLYQKWSPSRLSANFKTPMLIIHGEHDFRIPYTQALQLFTALQRQGVPSKLLFFPDETHFVQKPQNAQLWWKTVNDWFEKYLKN